MAGSVTELRATRTVPILGVTTITTAVAAGLSNVEGLITTGSGAGSEVSGASLAGANAIVAEAQVVYGSGGTTIDVYVQTSLDGGVTWIDIMNFHFMTSTANKVSKVSSYAALAAGITPGDAALASNTILDGLIGDRVRVKYVTVGTYGGGTTLRVDLVIKG
jgi:hypothetical protein